MQECQLQGPLTIMDEEEIDKMEKDRHFCTIRGSSFLLYIHCIAMFTGYPVPIYTISISCQPECDKGFSNNVLFTSYKYVIFGYPKVHRLTYFIVISTDDLAPSRPHIRI